MSIIYTGLSIQNNNKSSLNFGQSLGLLTATDIYTSASSTVRFFAVNHIPYPIVSAKNTGVTTTNATTLYIENAPIAGTNQTILNAYSLYVASGKSYLGDSISTTRLVIPSAGATSGSSSGLYIAPSSTNLYGANNYYFTYLEAPVSTGTTTGSASTLYISGAPKSINSTTTAAVPYSLNIAAGNSYFGGNVKLSGSISGTNVGAIYSTTSNARKSFTVNQDVYGQTLKKSTVSFVKRVVIKTSDININIIGFPKYDQIYTFGRSIPIRHIAVGTATNAIAYSDDGVRWNGVPNSYGNSPNIFGSNGYGVFWNGNIWVAGGDKGASGSNTMAYSFDGIIWVGLGLKFATSCRNVLWGNNMWVAIGSDTIPIKYSYDGITWMKCYNVGGADFNGFNEGLCVAYNGYMWIVGGNGGGAGATYRFAWSVDGIYWTTIVSPFSTYCHGIAWNGNMWVAGGTGTNTMAYAINDPTVSANWVAVTSSPFTTGGYNVKWNGTKWVAGGAGTNSLAFSLNGTNWTGLGTGTNSNVYAIHWNGYMWSSGGDTNPFVYGLDGMNWTSSINGWVNLGGSNVFSAQNRNISSNYSRLHSIKFPRNIIVAGGQSGGNSIMYTFDGINWNASAGGSSIFTSACFCIAWNGSIWLAGGDNSKFAFSRWN